MKIERMNWMQVGAYLENDDRAVLPIGSTEQHAYLSLATDWVLAERLATDVAEPLGVPVLPAIAYGCTPNFTAFPGTVSLRVETLCALVRDVLDSLESHGFRRVLIVNGHGGNAPAQGLVHEWLAEHPDMQVKWHNWWNAPQVWKKVVEIDPVASHASWMENFPWTRLEGVALPREPKPELPVASWLHMGAEALREKLGDGAFAGRYQREDDEMFAMWRIAVDETRALLETGWR